MDGRITGENIEFRSYYLPDGNMEFQYQGTINQERTEMSGTYVQIVGGNYNRDFIAIRDAP